uniref:Uncharacterized protein n=1 Tax=Panagrolaimus sp. JU765 TaxID=591449 RepID=A0AC34RQ87_9BILA
MLLTASILIFLSSIDLAFSRGPKLKNFNEKQTRITYDSKFAFHQDPDQYYNPPTYEREFRVMSDIIFVRLQKADESKSSRAVNGDVLKTSLNDKNEPGSSFVPTPYLKQVWKLSFLIK